MSKSEDWYDTYDIMYEHFMEMRERSEDYSKGYRAGWNDCYKMFKDLIKKDPPIPTPSPLTPTTPYVPQTYQPWQNVVRTCPQCGLQLTDALGRPIPLGYVCNNNNCPTFPKVTYTTGTGVPLGGNYSIGVHYTSNNTTRS